MLNGFGLLNLFCQSLVYQFFPGLSPHSGVLPHPGVQVLYWLPLAGHSEGRGDALMREGWFAWKFELPLAEGACHSASCLPPLVNSRWEQKTRVDPELLP